MNTIHPSAVINAHATLGNNNDIGPNVVIEADVELGDGNQLMAGAVIKSGARIGNNNRIHEYAVIAGLPQDISFHPEELTTVEIGDANTFHEHVTINRATIKQDRVTRVGNENYFMVGTHVAHDCHIGNKVVVAPYSGFAGHVQIDNGAFISGGVMVHQFVKIGRYAMIGGNAKITQDVLPYMITDGVPGTVRGLNLVGLRRAGFTRTDMQILKQAYQLIHRSSQSQQAILDDLGAIDSPYAQHLAEFIATSSRSFHREK